MLPDLTDNLTPGSDSVPTPDGLAPAFLHTVHGVPHVWTGLDEPKETSCQKLLFSATLTRDPSKIGALNLRDPKYFVVQGSSRDAVTQEEGVLDLVMEKFNMPATLSVSDVHIADVTACSSVGAGTYDRLRICTETADAISSGACTGCQERARLHKVCRLDDASGEAVRVFRTEPRFVSGTARCKNRSPRVF